MQKGFWWEQEHQARALFYPTLLYNVLRNKIQPEFRWWDRVDEAHDIDHLVIPTRDYLFAPSFADTCRAVDFIHEKASSGKTTYVHCKAGQGRSTTIVLCYLVEHRRMTPDAAYEYVRSIRPRVLLAPAQQPAVRDYHLLKVKNNGIPGNSCCLIAKKTLVHSAKPDTAAFDDGSVVVVTKSDLDGYEASFDTVLSAKEMLGEGSLAGKFQFASQAAIARLSFLWLHCHVDQRTSRKPGPLSSLGNEVYIHSCCTREVVEQIEHKLAFLSFQKHMD